MPLSLTFVLRNNTSMALGMFLQLVAPDPRSTCYTMKRYPEEDGQIVQGPLEMPIFRDHQSQRVGSTYQGAGKIIGLYLRLVQREILDNS